MDFQLFFGQFLELSKMEMRLAFISAVIVAILGLCSLIFTVRRGNFIRVVVSEQPSTPSSPTPRDDTPSSPSPRDGVTEFEVFLSFRGEDTRNGFTGHLHQTLKDKGVRAFIDNEDLQKGQRVDELFGYVEKSKIVVAIFSKRYADSKWCLKEIAKAVECEKLIIPLFFDVEPTDVRHQSGPFKSPFEQHQKNKSLDQREVAKWREALSKVGEISGFNLTTDTNRHEAKLVQIIVKRILEELNKNMFCVEKFAVGLDNSVEDVMNLLNLQADGVRAVGIFGMGGLGKTTLVEAVYNKICLKFDASCFIYSIRSNDIPSLQKQLLRDVFKEEVQINDANQGINHIKQRINRKRVLLILDDIDDKEQFSKLAGSTDWFCRGSRIIITTRDKDVLKRAGVIEDNIYELNTLNEHQSLELFSYHAFRRKEPVEGYEQLSQQVTSVAAGLPLALEVFGSLFFDLGNPEMWRAMHEKLQNCQNREIHEKLKLSFEGLDEGEKEIFLDIVCFLIGEDVKYATYMWEGCQFYPKIALGVLKHKSLIKISSYNKFEIHDQIRDMGRQIVKQEHGGDLRKRSRLWDENEISRALQNPEGTCNTEAIVLNAKDWDDKPPVNTKAFETMTSKARLLHVSNVPLEGKECPCLPSTLTWLQWSGFPFKEFPLVPHLHNIVVLHLSGSFELTCLQLEGFNKLKVLVIQSCKNLTVTPDFSSMPHLEILIFDGCNKLSTVHESIGCLKSLVYLSMRWCSELKELPDSLCQLSSLKKLVLGYTKIATLPDSMPQMKNLTSLDFRETNIKEIPESIGQLTNLQDLNVACCRRLRVLPNSIGHLKNLTSLIVSGTHVEEIPEFIWQLTNLQILDVGWCDWLRVLPNSIGNLKNLTSLDFQRTTIEEIPESIGQLTKLQDLRVAWCDWLRVLPKSMGNLKNLTSLDFKQTTIEEIPESIGQLTNLQKLSVAWCHRLRVLPNNIGNLKNLTSLDFQGTAIEEIPESIGQLTNLQDLNVECCRQLRVLPNSIGNLKNLKFLYFQETTIEQIPESIGQLTNLQDLNGAGCHQLRVLPNSLGNLRNLTILDFKETLIEEVPESIGSLEKLKYVDLSRKFEAEPTVALPTFFPSKSLETLKLVGRKLARGMDAVEDFGKMSSLRELAFSHSEIESLPSSFGGLSQLEKLSVNHCQGLQFLSPISNLTDLEYLSLDGCEKLVDIPGLEGLNFLEELSLIGCTGLLSLPQLPTSLQLLNASGCSALMTIPDISNLRDLRSLNLMDCEKLEDVPGLEHMFDLRTVLVAGCGGGSFLGQPRLCERIKAASFNYLEEFSISGSLSPSGIELSFLIPKGSDARRAYLYLGTCEAAKEMKEMSICIEEVDNDGRRISKATAQPPLSVYDNLLHLHEEEIKTIKLESQYREWKGQRTIHVSINNGLLIGGDLVFDCNVHDHRRCLKFARKQYRCPTNERAGLSLNIVGSCYCGLKVEFHEHQIKDDTSDEVDLDGPRCKSSSLQNWYLRHL